MNRGVLIALVFGGRDDRRLRPSSVAAGGVRRASGQAQRTVAQRDQVLAGADAIGGIPCNAATVTIGMSAGVGYLIPRSIADAINWFLRALNVGEIASEGGIEGKGMNIVNQTTYHPRSNACRP